MTINQFVKRLAAKSKRQHMEWTLMPTSGAIRQKSDYAPQFCHCPLSFVAGTPPCLVTLAQQKLKLSRRDAWIITDAADCERTGDVQLRQRLLHAIGKT